MSIALLAILKGQQKGIVANLVISILYPFSFVYRLGLFCHQQFCRFKGIYQALSPVISIGNITLGGVGKTPLVIFLAKALSARGFKPIVVTRGYRLDQSSFSDEVEMIKEELKGVELLVGPNRCENIKASEGKTSQDVYLLDDGFQHWPLKRNVDIVAIDARNPFGNGLLLPAGILREPLSALKRADIFILTKAQANRELEVLKAKLHSINPKALIAVSTVRYKGLKDVFLDQDLSVDILTNAQILVFAAIGDPGAFEEDVRKFSPKSIARFNFRDHHVYEDQDIKDMVTFSQDNQINMWVTTHKDAVKLRQFKMQCQGITVAYLPIQVEITQKVDELIDKITAICRR